MGSTLGLAVVCTFGFGVFALEDLHDSRDCSAHGGRTDHLGGEFDDLFTVCRESGGRIVKVYASNGGDDEEVARCATTGGKLYNDGSSKAGMSMMCVIDGQMAWWSEQ